TGSSARASPSASSSTTPTAASPTSTLSGSSRSTGRSGRSTWPASSMDTFESFPEQAEAKRLLRAAVAEGSGHAFLFHGPAGVGKRRAALAFAAELIGNQDRVLRRAHPD